MIGPLGNPVGARTAARGAQTCFAGTPGGAISWYRRAGRSRGTGMGGKRQVKVASADGAGGYALVRQAIPLLGAGGDAAAGIGNLAAGVGRRAEDVQRALERWSGLSLAAFARALTVDHLRGRLADAGAVLAPADRMPVHDFDVLIAATVTDAAGRRGEGLEIGYGFHLSPFGIALVMMTADGVCGLAFVDDDAMADRQAALDDMTGRWPRAAFREAPEVTALTAARIFGAPARDRPAVVPLVLIGTAFDLSVWQALLRIPMGRIVSYAGIARHLGRPDASRAVGTANGRNPISFVVPCHRALRGDGALGGYYWGLERKRALLAWEAGRIEALEVMP